MSDRSATEQAINLFFEAINTNNAAIIPLADDVVMSGPMMPEPKSGQAAVREYINEIAPFISKVVVKTVIVESDRAAVIASFEMLNGVSFDGAEFFQLENGLITQDLVFFDTRKLFKGTN